MRQELKQKLIEWADKYETPKFIESDPIKFPHRALEGCDPRSITKYQQQKVEAVAVITAWLSYGNRKQIIKVAGEVYEIVMQEGFFEKRLYRAFRNNNNTLYRFYKWSDLYCLCERLRLIFQSYRSLESYFIQTENKDPLLFLIRVFKGVKGFPVNNKSACKRLCLLLRWLGRWDSPVDLGIWLIRKKDELIIPLDTHVHRMALELGLTKRKQADMRTAVEITEALREVFPDDPTRGDFALFGYGIENK